MPVINIYLDKELYEFVKKDKSRIIKQALKEYKEKLKQRCERPCPDGPNLCKPCTLPEPINTLG